jgi:hypothetical protein
VNGEDKMMEDGDMVEEEDNENNNNSFQFLLNNKRERSILTTCKGQELRTGNIMQFSVCKANR